MDPLNLKEQKSLQERLNRILRQQIANNEPPVTRQTHKRLMQKGYPEEEIWVMMSTALLVALNESSRRKQVFSMRDFTAWMEGLPDLSFVYVSG